MSLSERHLAQLRDSAISDEVREARGYRTIEAKSTLNDLGFTEPQQRVPALSIPIHDVFGKVHPQIRPDFPRQGPAGKVVKYDRLAGKGNVLDVPPGARKLLGDPRVRLLITEGSKKADSAVSAGECCIALMGVWNWVGTNEHGAKGVALADWREIALSGRTVYLAFDSDLMTKSEVQRALDELKRYLEGKGAKVTVLYLPAGPNGEKVGLDDYLAAGHSTEELLALVEPPRASVEPGHGPLAAIPEYPLDALPAAVRSLVDGAAKAGLPAALTGGAALAALAVAIGPNASLEARYDWKARAILWVPLLAPRGAGKSPAQELAFGPLRSYDTQVWAEYQDALREWRSQPPRRRGPRPKDPTLLGSDTTLEAIARRLDVSEGLGLDLDELSLLLRGLGEYKSRGGGDRGRFLALWTGSPWRYTRVGSGGDSTNGVDILAARPTLVLCGGLQPTLAGLLGAEDDGMRPRWLPHLSALPELALDEKPTDGKAWAKLIARELIPERNRVRFWTVSDDARKAFLRWQRKWKTEARGDENATVSAALIKADVHLLRVALVWAEAEQPARGGQVGPELIERSAAVIEYTLNCWRALPEHGGLALSQRDERLDRAVERLRDWLEQHGGEASRHALLKLNVAGAQTAADLNQLLERYEARYPGTVQQKASTGGRPAVVVTAPPRVTPSDTFAGRRKYVENQNAPSEPDPLFKIDRNGASQQAANPPGESSPGESQADDDWLGLDWEEPDTPNGSHTSGPTSLAELIWADEEAKGHVIRDMPGGRVSKPPPGLDHADEVEDIPEVESENPWDGVVEPLRVLAALEPIEVDDDPRPDEYFSDDEAEAMEA